MNNEHGINYLKKIIPEDNLKIYLKSELKKYLNKNLNKPWQKKHNVVQSTYKQVRRST